MDDGGPAFPYESYDYAKDMDTVKPGMSLRDWFAGQALAGRNLMSVNTWDGADNGAKAAYAIADAMLAARKEGSGP